MTFSVQGRDSSEMVDAYEHNQRIPNPKHRGGLYPGYVRVDKIDQNVSRKSGSAESFLANHESRFKKRNEAKFKRVEEWDAKLASGVTDGLSKVDTRKVMGPKPRVRPMQNKGYHCLIGMTDDWHEGRVFDTPEKKEAVQNLFYAGLEVVKKELGLSDDDIDDEVIHWDENKPHFHFTSHSILENGKTFSKVYDIPKAEKVIKAINQQLGLEGFTPYREQRALGIKTPKRKSTKRMKAEEAERQKKAAEKIADLKKKTEQLATISRNLAQINEDFEFAQSKVREAYTTAADLNKVEADKIINTTAIPVITIQEKIEGVSVDSPGTKPQQKTKIKTKQGSGYFVWPRNPTPENKRIPKNVDKNKEIEME